MIARLRRLPWAREGVTTIEFALVAPILALLIVGILDFGIGLWRQMQVATAAQAGAAYASTNGWNATATGIANAVTGATGLGSITATPAPAWACGCPNATSGIAWVACGSTCPDGSQSAHYVTIGAQAAYSTILPYPGLANPLTLSAASFARLYP